MTYIVIDLVDPARRVVSAFVTPEGGKRHRLGYLPSEGWFCTCPKGKSCRQIDHVRKLVPQMEQS